MKKKIILSIVAIFVVAASLVTYFIIKDLKQESKLQDEVNDVLTMLDDLDHLDIDGINRKLSRTITKGDYAVVEKAFKEYINDYLYDLNLVGIISTLNDEKIITVLSIENYKQDGPDFANTKEYLQKTITFLNESINKYNEYISEEKIMSYINDKNVSEYYKELYRNDIIGDIEGEKDDKTFEESINAIVELLKNTDNIIDLLKNNKDKWYIENDQIVFSSESVLTEYQKLFDSFEQ